MIIEKRATVLCLGVFFAIIFVGKAFGGRLLGLIPLAMCVSSGIFLWMKDLIRQGRDVEWSSEQKRGETAVVNLIPESVEWMNSLLGIIWGLINPEMFASVADTLEVRHNEVALRVTVLTWDRMSCKLRSLASLKM